MLQNKEFFFEGFISEDVLKEVVKKIKQKSDLISKLYDLNIDIINMSDPAMDALWLVLKYIFHNNKILIDLLEWWIYEDVEKIIYYEEDGKKIEKDLTSFKDFYNYLYQVRNDERNTNDE